MSKKQCAGITILCVVLAILLTFAATTAFWVIRRSPLNPGTSTVSTEEGALYSESKLQEIQAQVEHYFIGEVDQDKMTETLAAAMIDGLGDEWSYYIPAEEYASYMESVRNSYVGIGVTISWEDKNPDGFTVIDVTPDSPAYQAGLQIGDIMHSVEGELVTELGMDETKNRVRGEAGTKVTLTVLREGSELEFTITRNKIKTINVTWELLEDDVGYIRIRNFEEHCADDTILAIKDLRSKGAKGLVFDVRNNPGGLKSELVELLDYLLPEGVLFRYVEYDGKEYSDKSDARYLDMPMAVLVNLNSYSASEFFAAALQEYGAATIVGTQTYGKGYFQTTHLLSDGSAVHISSGKYFTPNGVSLTGVGITPDKVVEISEEEEADIYYNRMEHQNDKQLQTAIEAVKE